MKTLTKTTDEPTTAEQIIAEARDHAEACHAALRRGCGHALAAGLRLVWLHKMTAGDGHGGDRRSEEAVSSVTRDTRLGFAGACEQIGIIPRTAYRWMNAARVALLRAELLREDEDLMGELPEPGTPRWEQWEAGLQKFAEGVSLNRLVLGCVKAGSDTHRISELADAAEEGRARAIELLEAVDMGRYTLAQAVKALGSQEAYDRLRAEGGEKVRPDPVYLSVNGRTGELGGLMPRALKTLKNAFDKWAETPEPARKAIRNQWIEVLLSAPDDLAL